MNRRLSQPGLQFMPVLPAWAGRWPGRQSQAV